nr:MAG TPA: hypothetical protein [Bacteriophage sp.]
MCYTHICTYTRIKKEGIPQLCNLHYKTQFYLCNITTLHYMQDVLLLEHKEQQKTFTKSTKEE